VQKPKLALSERMARIRKADTKPELIVRRIAHGLGYRYRLHRRDLPRTTDLVFPRLHKVILVHGCFWHRHDCPDGREVPKSKPDYWIPKFARNVARDARTRLALENNRWSVLVLWECEVRDEARRLEMRWRQQGLLRRHRHSDHFSQMNPQPR
jgi:DNA mismatch endonuclease (patch repair protein)